MRRILPLLILALLFFGCAKGPSTLAPELSPTSEPTSSPQPVLPWWRQAVFYEIFVRSFYDSNGDGVGDFNGITQKLDYLNDGNPFTDDDLGITAIWLMPIHPSPSYHGYDVVNYYAINPDYGSMEDFHNFLSEAHKRGIKVVIDLVVNHTSNRHPFFQDALRGTESEYHDWYIWSATSKGAGWHQVLSGPDPIFYYGYFCDCMPDLNYENPQVTSQMFKVVDYWLNTIGVDGFRVDGAKHLIEEPEVQLNSPGTHTWFREFYSFYKEIQPDAYTVGEVASSDARMISTYTGDQFDQIFNFEFASGIVNSVDGEAVSGIKSAVTFIKQDMPDWDFGTFLTNHDQNRVMSVLDGNVEKAKLAAFILLTSPGTPYIYYGEEIGMQGQKPDEYIRRPMQWAGQQNGGFSTTTPWEELDPNYAEVNIEAQSDDPQSLLSTYRNLIRLRESYPTLATGEYSYIDTSHPRVYSYTRKVDAAIFLMVVNLSKEQISDYGLSIDDLGLQDGTYDLVDVLSNTTIGQVTIQNGGNSAYKPLEILDPYSSYLWKVVK